MEIVDRAEGERAEAPRAFAAHLRRSQELEAEAQVLVDAAACALERVELLRAAEQAERHALELEREETQVAAAAADAHVHLRALTRQIERREQALTDALVEVDELALTGNLADAGAREADLRAEYSTALLEEERALVAARVAEGERKVAELGQAVVTEREQAAQARAEATDVVARHRRRVEARESLRERRPAPAPLRPVVVRGGGEVVGLPDGSVRVQTATGPIVLPPGA